jgi:hypothetical protein
MAYFDRLNPISQACTTIIDVLNFQFEEEEGNTFNIGTSMEESSHALVVRELNFLKKLSIPTFACVDPMSCWWHHENWFSNVGFLAM